MKKSKVQKIKSIPEREGLKQKIPITKEMIQRAKKQYLNLPWNKRHLV